MYKRQLLDMVIEFYVLQMKFCFTCIVVHVAGTRMIAQGGDGLSRGATNEGATRGVDFLLFILLHVSAFDRSSALKDWVTSRIKDKDHVFLLPQDWFVSRAGPAEPAAG